MQLKVLTISGGGAPVADVKQQYIGDMQWKNGQVAYQMYAAEQEIQRLSPQDQSYAADVVRIKLAHVLDDLQATMQKRSSSYFITVTAPSYYTLKMQKLLDPSLHLKLTAYGEDDELIFHTRFPSFEQFRSVFAGVMDDAEFSWLIGQLESTPYAVDVFENRRLVEGALIQGLGLMGIGSASLAGPSVREEAIR